MQTFGGAVARRAETKMLNETTLGDSGAVPTLTNLNSGFSELSSILELLRSISKAENYFDGTHISDLVLLHKQFVFFNTNNLIQLATVSGKGPYIQ